MLTAEQNYRLLQEIEANRRFLLMAYQQNPKLLERAEMRIKQLFDPPAHGADNIQSSVLSPQSSERGISLIELIMFIVIVSVALAGILLVMNVTTRGSADPLIHKQALAIAESLLEEVELMPFTFCDPDDPAAGLATTLDATACVGGVGGVNDESKLPLGPETAASVGGAEGRYTVPQYDNVSDYNGFAMAAGALKDITNIAVGPTGYAVAVVVTENGMPAVGASPAIAAAEALLIKVTVTGPDNVDVVVEGIRTRYAPRAVP